MKSTKYSMNKSLIKKYGNSYFFLIPKSLFDTYNYGEKKFEAKFTESAIILSVVKDVTK
jgi:hypothetical protein